MSDNDKKELYKQQLNIISGSGYRHTKLNLLERIFNLSREKGFCYAGQTMLATRCGIKPRACQIALKQLETDGAITSRPNRGRPNDYEINWVCLAARYEQRGGIIPPQTITALNLRPPQDVAEVTKPELPELALLSAPTPAKPCDRPPQNRALTPAKVCVTPPQDVAYKSLEILKAVDLKADSVPIRENNTPDRNAAISSFFENQDPRQQQPLTQQEQKMKEANDMLVSTFDLEKDFPNFEQTFLSWLALNPDAEGWQFYMESLIARNSTDVPCGEPLVHQ